MFHEQEIPITIHIKINTLYLVCIQEVKNPPPVGERHTALLVSPTSSYY